MPEIVKACYKQLLSVAEQRVILITEENYTQWVQLPRYIIEKHDKGIITTTHFSDIVRAALLNEYGGLWLDATIYVKEIPEYIFEKDYYTLHAPGMFPEFISRGEWASFLLYGKKNRMHLFGMMIMVFSEYWKTQNKLIDYLLVDYIIRLILNHHTELAKSFNNQTVNYDYYALNQCINKEYCESESRSILFCSPFQKLTYKKEFRMITEEGKETYYSRIISERFCNE